MSLSACPTGFCCFVKEKLPLDKNPSLKVININKKETEICPLVVFLRRGAKKAQVKCLGPHRGHALMGPRFGDHVFSQIPSMGFLLLSDRKTSQEKDIPTEGHLKERHLQRKISQEKDISRI